VSVLKTLPMGNMIGNILHENVVLEVYACTILLTFFLQRRMGFCIEVASTSMVFINSVAGSSPFRFFSS